jgi:hypothetical protein
MVAMSGSRWRVPGILRRCFTGMNLDGDTTRDSDTTQDDLVTSELGLWEPLSIDAVSKLLHSATVPWWIAGGWAIDLHLGRHSRTHADVDVLVLRPHLQDLRRCLAGWDLYAAYPPGTLGPWPAETRLPSGVHDVWCRSSRQHPWQLQLMVDDLAVDDDTAWVYRRDERIRRPWATLTGPASQPGRPVLTPEIQLLYKSHQPRPKDQADFDALSDELPDDQRRWLVAALQLIQPNHPWIQRLAGA